MTMYIYPEFPEKTRLERGSTSSISEDELGEKSPTEPTVNGHKQSTSSNKAEKTSHTVERGMKNTLMHESHESDTVVNCALLLNLIF